MKKEHVEKYRLGVYTDFSLFIWHQCASCNEDFRREKGYRFLVGPFYNGGGVWRYLCSQCISSKAEAHAFALFGGNSKRPSPPLRK